MTNFTKKSQAESEIAIGEGQINSSNVGGRDMLGIKISNKDRLALARSGAKNLVSGTIKKNRIKKGLPPLRRPPEKTKTTTKVRKP